MMLCFVTILHRNLSVVVASCLLCVRRPNALIISFAEIWALTRVASVESSRFSAIWWLAVTHRSHTNPQLACVRSLLQERPLLSGTDALPAFVRQLGPIPLVLVQCCQSGCTHEQIHDLADEKASVLPESSLSLASTSKTMEENRPLY